eukprot:TRINITY_DN7737_c0_g1_i4.p1 TRINITY_DN7737_c0_g1~~TRINITY_DN7737_c0_g1_i4.p1  ORF type:complete len:721 (-),score=124.23 TRINITY_DN7737_c0_g1_i4:129-2291(-)
MNVNIIFFILPLFLLLESRSVQPGASPKVIKAWEKVGRVDPHHPVAVTFALKQNNVKWLHQKVLDVSQPLSENYGRYLSLEEITEKMAPSQEVLNKFKSWAIKSGATETHVTLSRDFFTVVFPAKQLEEILSVRLHHFQHKTSKRSLVRTLDPVYLPEEIEEHVELITGLGDFFDFQQERKEWHQVRRRQLVSATSAPTIRKIKGSETDVDVFVVVYCLDGTPVTSLSNPCSGHGPAPSKVTVRADTYTASVHLNSGKCDQEPSAVVCELDVTVPAYQRVNVSAFTTYSTGQQSEIFWYPTLHSPTPWVSPQYIYSTYGIPQGYRASNYKNSQSVVAFEEQYISFDDLQQFFTLMGLPETPVVVVGQNDPSNPGGESTLDIQYITGVGAGVNTTFWSVTGNGPAKPPGHGAYILEWAKQIADTPDAPLVTSISYGDTEQGFFLKFGNYDYITRMNVELAKMSARGLTVVAGSGDAGASNVGEEGNDISDTDPTCTPMRPFFPSNSPYVVSVSSTFPSPNALPICRMNYTHYPIVCSQIGEVAVAVSQGVDWTTGGGFSGLSPTLGWQATMVDEFLRLSGNSLPPISLWNSTGRAYPDISTLGRNLICIEGGRVDPCSGTSASGPVLGGIFSLLNDIRLNNNLPTLGLPTPLLYALQRNEGKYFRDVVVGDNFDGDIQQRGSPYPTFCPYGFLTQPGWDAVTGLGTPYFPTLAEAVSTTPI